MRATNHVVTGAVIGAAVGNPWIALPAAFLSHFVLDAIPHADAFDRKSLAFKVELLTDSALAASFLLFIFLVRPDQWPLLIACGILGASPDLLWIPAWLRELKTGKDPRYNRFEQLLVDIQWCTSPQLYIVEVIWLLGGLYAFFALTA
jgi:hypothetical protein